MKKSNNKGFTLVELIIVVAIIAVLAAVLAPQYLRYVERARQSNDLQVATSIMRAATAAISDPQVGVSSASDVLVTWDTDGTPVAPTLTVSIGGSTSSAMATSVLAEIAQTMGWATSVSEDATTGVHTVTWQTGGIDDAQSSAGNGAAFSFTIDAATGQIELEKVSEKWATEIGVSQPVKS